MKKYSRPLWVLLLLAASGCALCDVDISKQTLGDIRQELGIYFEGADAFEITRRAVRGGEESGFWSLAAEKHGTMIKVELINNIDAGPARRHIEERYFVINSLYTSVPSPYPGMISNTIDCPKAFRPRQRVIEVAGEKSDVLLLSSTSRYTYGACVDDLIAYRGALTFVYNHKRRALYRIDLFVPKKVFQESEVLALLRTLKFVSAAKAEQNGLADLIEQKSSVATEAGSRAEGKAGRVELKDYNLIIVAFEPLGANHVGAYGYSRDTTPHLDSFSKDAFLFKNAVSPSSWTLPIFMSWFTSLYPAQHGILNKYSRGKDQRPTLSVLSELSPTAVTLAQALKNNGYTTAGFTGGAGVASRYGYSQGFDTYDDEKTFAGFDVTFPLALKWLEQHRNEKFFLFVQGYDVHGRYEVPRIAERQFVDPDYKGKYEGTIQEYWELRNLSVYGSTKEEIWKSKESASDQYQLNMTAEDARFWNAIYDGKIQEADRKFGQFLAALEKLGLTERTIVVVSSGSGNEYLEHKRFDHGYSLYDEVIMVPLILRVPGMGSGVIPQQVRAIDIMPTALDLLGAASNSAVVNQMQGVSLVPMLKGKQLSLDAFSETDYVYRFFKRSLRTSDGWKYIYSMDTEARELYNLNNDPMELKNLIDQEKSVAYKLEKKLFDHLQFIDTKIDRKRSKESTLTPAE